MSQIAKLTATIAAGASDQAVAHGLERIPDLIYIVEKAEGAIKDAIMTRCLTDVAAAIGATPAQVTGAATVDVTIANIFYAGVTIGANFWTLTGFDCTNLMYNKCLLCVDDGGTMTIGAGTEAAAEADVVLPATPADSVVLAVLSVHVTGVGDFTGGTDDLDDGTIIPTATFEDVAFHPDVFGEITVGAAADATNVHIDNSMAVARDVEIIVATLHSLIA